MSNDAKIIEAAALRVLNGAASIEFEGLQLEHISRAAQAASETAARLPLSGMCFTYVREAATGRELLAVRTRDWDFVAQVMTFRRGAWEDKLRSL